MNANQFYLRMKNTNYQDSLRIINDKTLIVKAQDRSRSLKDQKEKQLKFTKIYTKIPNEQFFQELYPSIIKDFLYGQNHTTLIVGSKGSGKTHNLIGNIRDPGIILFALQELFNQIDDRHLEDNVTIKLSVFEYHPIRGFRDLLVDGSWECMPIQNADDLKLLGLPEIIVDNFLLALKILRIALVNLQDFEQNIDTERFREKVRGTNLVVEIKAEIAPNSDVREQVMVSRLRFVKSQNEADDGPFTSALTTLLKSLDPQNPKIECSHPLVKYLGLKNRVNLIACIGSEYMATLKLCNFVHNIVGQGGIYSFSIFQWMIQLKSLIENVRDAVCLLTREFAQYDKSRAGRGESISQILLEISNYFTKFLDILEIQSELNYNINCLYSQYLSNHCQKYSNIINTEDVKEFYLAKVEVYAIEEMVALSEQILPILKETLNQIHQRHNQLQSLRQAMSQYFNRINKFQHLSVFDLQRLANLTRLSKKLMNTYILTQQHNIFNSLEARNAIVYVFQQIHEMDNMYHQKMELYDEILEIEVPQVEFIPLEKKVEETQEIIKGVESSPPDLIEQLFFNKFTKNYVKDNSSIFPTQIPGHPVIQPQKPLTTKSNRFNFFDELQKRQKRFNKSSIINPNQIKHMVIEWQEKRHQKLTGISQLKLAHLNLSPKQNLLTFNQPLGSSSQKAIIPTDVFPNTTKNAQNTFYKNFKKSPSNILPEISENQYKRFFIQ